jgi:hypothetical protein
MLTLHEITRFLMLDIKYAQNLLTRSWIRDSIDAECELEKGGVGVAYEDPEGVNTVPGSVRCASC